MALCVYDTILYHCVKKEDEMDVNLIITAIYTSR